MDAMPITEPRHAKRSGWATAAICVAVGVAVLFTVADAALGGISSFFNLTRAGAEHGWRYPWMLPLIIDAGVPIYVLVDHVLVAIGRRSLLARAAAWMFAAVTVILNGAVAPTSSVFWHGVYMAAPAAWVLGIECLRSLWRMLREPAREAGGRPSLAEWWADRERVKEMWRRKHALGVASWAAMRRRDEARLLLSDLAAAREVTGEPVPPAVARATSSGWLPGDLALAVERRPAAEWEPLLTRWAGEQMALPAVLRNAILNATPEPLPDAIPAPPEPPAQEPPSGAARTPRRTPSRKGTRKGTLTAQALADLAREKLPAHPVPSVNELMKLGGVGRPKARAAHDLLTDGGRVVDLPARAAR